MRPEYSLYGLDDVYLFETPLIYYSYTTGEIFINGKPLSKMIDGMSLRDYISSLYGDYHENIIEIFFEGGIDNPYIQKLIMIHGYNGYFTEHFLYIVLRSNGLGIHKSIDILREVGCRYWIFRNLLLDTYLKKSCLSSCPRKWNIYVSSIYPSWMDVERKIIYRYLKEEYPKYLQGFRDYDRFIRECMRKSGVICGEVYIKYLARYIKDFPIRDIVINSKLVVSEAIYRDYRERGGGPIVIPPLYKGLVKV